MRMLVFIAALLSGLIAPAANASPTPFIRWTAWLYDVPGSNGWAFGESVTGVYYSGNVVDILRDTPSWLPPETFGDQPPLTWFGALEVQGTSFDLNRLTFFPALVNPTIAIWRLGREGAPTLLAFNHPLTIDSGGPSLEYGGSSIVPVGASAILGEDGNGVFHFKGNYRELLWYAMGTDDTYVLTVGGPRAAWCYRASCDEPLTLSLFAVSIGGLGLWRRRGRQSTPRN